MEFQQIINSCASHMTVFKKSEASDFSFLSNDAELSFLRVLMRRSQDMIVILDKSGIYKYVSPAVIDILGYQPEDIIGKSFREFVEKGALEIDPNIFNQLLLTKEQVLFDFWMRKSDGSKILVENLAINLLHDKHIEGILFNGRDITDLFLAKQQLQKKHELERLVSTITAKFVNSSFGQLDTAFNHSLQDIVDFFGASKAFLYHMNREKTSFDLLFQWEEQLGQLQKKIPKGFFINHLLPFEKDGLIFVSHQTGVNYLCNVFFQEDSYDHSQCLIVPIYASQSLIGFFGFMSDPNFHGWKRDDLLSLRQLSDLYASAFINRFMNLRLEKNEKLLIETELLASSGSWRFSPLRKKIFFTPGLEKVLGLGSNKNQISPKDLFKFIPSHERQEVFKQLRKAYQNLSNVRGETVIVTWDGVEKIISYFIQGRQGYTTGDKELFGHITDISKERQNLKEMRNMQDQYRVLASNIPYTNVFLVNQELRYVVAQGTIFERWELSSGDFEGKLLTEVHPLILPNMASLIIEAIESASVIQSSFVHLDRYHEVMVRPLFNEHTLAYVLVIIRDIEDEYQAKEKLKRSEEKFRTLVEDSTEIIFSLKPDLTITYLSPNVKQYLGYEVDQVLGKKLSEYLHPSDIAAFSEFRTENPNFLFNNNLIEFRLKTAENTYKIFSSHGKLVVGSQNAMLYNGVARDVTKLKEAQKELVLAKEKAELAVLAKSQFLSIMSHEIRTPMNAVIGLAHLLLEDDPRQDQLENLKTLQFSAENLLGLINDILDFNKMESGKLTLESVPLNLKDLISRVIHSYAFQVREKNLTIYFHYDPSIPTKLLGDPVRISQIINNLLSNAVKFTLEGTITVKVDCLALREKEIDLKISVQDTGIGIAQDNMEVIFEPFTQASTETTRKYGGTGLGLAIVKKLIDLFESSIQVSSKTNQGTTISFVMTFHEAIAEIDTPLERTSPSISNLMHFKILIAEDNLVNQLLIKKFMKKWGVVQFQIASDGEEAIDWLQKEQYDLAILDIQMPVKDGFAVAAHVRTHENASIQKLPLIAMTASPFDEIKEDFEKFKFNVYIPKPFNPDYMYSKLIELLLI